MEKTLREVMPHPLNYTVGVYTIESRALMENYFDPEANALKYGDYHYIKVKMKKNSNVFIEFGEAMPWFEKQGGAIQIKCSEKFDILLNQNEIEIPEKYKYNLLLKTWELVQ
ncbi:hypothetical protein CNR22_12010 [Sphingobacteriaceae bacterium]|nr:hypothetical protein CNR22_12010 [Sphingobacteriaceae bacterium]